MVATAKRQQRGNEMPPGLVPLVRYLPVNSTDRVTRKIRMDAIFPPAHARCLDCGYGLAGLAGGVCPECGRRFNARWMKSMDLGDGEGGWFGESGLPGPGRKTNILIGALAAATVLDAAL